MIAIILGTRPEIIKMSPIIRECNNRRIGTSSSKSLKICEMPTSIRYSVPYKDKKYLTSPRFRAFGNIISLIRFRCQMLAFDKPKYSPAILGAVLGQLPSYPHYVINKVSDSFSIRTNQMFFLR